MQSLGSLWNIIKNIKISIKFWWQWKYFCLINNTVKWNFDLFWDYYLFQICLNFSSLHFKIAHILNMY